MDSQIQCPVCTLYLHVGMNLQDHLNTHPKEQVISALVNMTLLQQRANDESPNTFECSRYEPLSDDLSPEKSLPSKVSTSTFQNQHIILHGPVVLNPNQRFQVTQQSPQPTQLVQQIVQQQVFHDHRHIGVTSHQTSTPVVARGKTVPPLSIPTRTFRLIPTKSYEGKITQAIPPPPPYHASIRNTAQRNTSSRITNQSSGSTNILDVTTTCSTTLTTSINASSSAYVHNGTAKANETANQLSSALLEAPTSVGLGSISIASTNSNSNTSSSSSNSSDCETASKENSSNNDAVASEQQNLDVGSTSSKGDHDERPSIDENNDSAVVEADQISEGKVKGLKVLSNVQVSPSTILNVSSINQQRCESISLNNMIIVSAIPSTSSGVNSQLGRPQSLLKTLKKITASSSSSKPTNEEKVSNGGPSETEQSTKDECFLKPCSSKATSVIRMASQASPKLMSLSENVTRSSMKTPYNRQVKRLIVKLKKPFVPVIGEEANLHPPETITESICGAVKQERLTEEHSERNGNNSFPELKQSENEMLLECSEDVPFSPLRQSYTPLPIPDAEHTPADNDDIVTEENDDEQISTEELAKKKKNSVTNSFTEATDASPSCNDVAASDDTEVVIFTISTGSEEEVRRNDDAAANNVGKSVTTINSECTSFTSSTSSFSNMEPSSSQHNFQDVAGSSRMEYISTTFFDNHGKRNSEYFNSGVRIRLSPIPYVAENNTWNQQFSPPYTPFEENDKQSSYLDLMAIDGHKASSANARAPSTDSLNIRTDEKMPAKGEISEQESNGDIESSWSHQIHSSTENDNLPRYMNSYDTTVARESWSLSNEQHFPREIESMSTILMKFTPLDQTEQNLDVKPITDNFLKDTSEKEKPLVKSRKYRCAMCLQVFVTLKEKRSHLIEHHDYHQNTTMKIIPTLSKFIKIKRPNETITSASCSILSTGESSLIECKEEPGILKPFTSLNNYLLSYNWSTLKAKASEGTKDENKSLFAVLDGGVNYVCRVCEEQFNSIRAYDIHMATHPAECYTCGRTFKRWVNFSIHLKRHLNIRDHRCPHCPKRFVLRQSMIEHIRIHSNEAPLKCGLCMKRFKRFSNLIQHRNRHHLKLRPQAKDFICTCGEVFNSQAKIAWQRETHDVKPKCCPYCRERFMHKNSLVRHIRLSHTERFHLFKRDSVECPFCKKKYIKSSLKMHMEQHKTSRATYECTICNKTLTTKWNLKQHKWIHASRSSKPFKCSMCTKAFIRESEYTSHMNTHKAIKPYTCDHCGCQFARKYNWLRHTREHETVKKFRCDTCGKDFHRAYYLKEHKRIHTGERPFECVICGKTSTTKTNHNKHVKIHHARDPLTAEA